MPSYQVFFGCQKRAQLLLLLQDDLPCQRWFQSHSFLIIMHATLRCTDCIHILHTFPSVPEFAAVLSRTLIHRLNAGSPPPQQRPTHLASLENQQTPPPTKQTLASRAKDQKRFEKKEVAREGIEPPFSQYLYTQASYEYKYNTLRTTNATPTVLWLWRSNHWTTLPRMSLMVEECLIWVDLRATEMSGDWGWRVSRGCGLGMVGVWGLVV